MNHRSFTIWILAAMFAYFQNDYFGWHWKPQSDAEIICDGIVVLLFALSMIPGREPKSI